VVLTYLVNVIGIPVYFHYCGGELETVNYLVKGTSCCGEEEQDGEDDGCCEDEQVVLMGGSDFTIKGNLSFQFIKIIQQVFFTQTPFITTVQDSAINLHHLLSDALPVALQKKTLLSSFLLRI